MTSENRMPPLTGVKVLDMTRFIAGAYAAMLLADLGAEVVKVEPIKGDVNRFLGPMVGPAGQEQSTYYLRFNRRKKSLSVDLKAEAGAQVFRSLVQKADVLVENFRPGVLERLGFGWDALRALNPGLVYCSISGFGHVDAPLRERGAFTPIAEAMAAALIQHDPDRPPSTAGYPVGDIFPASLAVAGISAALLRREKDGRGARLDLAMHDAMLAMNERAIALSAMTGRNFVVGDRADLGAAPSAVFRAKDGFVSIAVVGEEIWQRFCRAIGRLDWAGDPRMTSGSDRAALFASELQPGISDWIEPLTRDEAVQVLSDAGVPAAGAALPLELLDSEQVRSRKMIVEYPAGPGVTATVVANPIKFAHEPEVPMTPAPLVGADTRSVLRDWTGLDPAAVEALLEAGVLRASD